jgi:hypothetical protein
MDGPKALTVVHGPLGLKYQPWEKATAIVDCLKNQFTPYDLFDEDRKWQVESRVQALLEAADDTP